MTLGAQDKSAGPERIEALSKAALLDALADAERIARLFHAAYETHAPSHGYETRKETSVPWDDLPENNRSLMVATVREVVDHILTDAYDIRRAMS